MFVGAEMVTDVPFDRARARLADLAGSWLAGAAGAAYLDGGRGLARVGPAPGLSRLVEVAFRDPEVKQGSAVMTLRWHAAGTGGGLFPVLDADLRLSPYEQSGTLVTLTGVYRPPLGALGTALDRAGLHLVAGATVRGFVTRVAEAIADPATAAAAAAARDPGMAEVRWWRVPLVPGQA